MTKPLVSVICLCFNHRHFLKEAVSSVLNQSYTNIEVIVIDDASGDGSDQLIKEVVNLHPEIKTILLSENVGNCKAFNLGLKLATGDFVIDFSTDDVMMTDRVEKQIDFFLKQDNRVGVVFTDSVYIDQQGASFRSHFEYLFNKKLIDHIPSGDVFRNVLTTYFICSPTMMIRKSVLEGMGGYDEALAYEDFDFWVRASRNFYFGFLNERLTKVRRSFGSMSTGWYKQGDKQLRSTYLVCEKALNLCRDEEDRKALQWRLLYEFKQAAFSRNKAEAKLFAGLLKKLGIIPPSFYIVRFVSALPFPWAWLRNRYHQLFYH